MPMCEYTGEGHCPNPLHQPVDVYWKGQAERFEANYKAAYDERTQLRVELNTLKDKHERLINATYPIYRYAHEQHAQVRLTENGHDPDCLRCKQIDDLYTLVTGEPAGIRQYREEHWPTVKDHPDDCECTDCWEYIAITEK